MNNLIISCDLPAGVEISSITISNDLTYEKILTNSSNLSFKKSNSAHPDGYVYQISVRLPNIEADKNPLVILLHGNGGNGSAMIANLGNLFEDHIIIAPTGFEHSWNIAEEKSNLPDVEFLRDLIRDLKLFSNVDENRIRLFGTSNGSALANRAFIEIDDPSIDIIIAVVSQLHEGQYRNDPIFWPIDPNVKDKKNTKEEDKEAIPDEIKTDSNVKTAFAQIQISEQTLMAGKLVEVREKFLLSPGNLDLKFELALALISENHNEEAIETLLQIIQKAADWNEGKAKMQLIELLDALGPDDQMGRAGRRRLSSILFS